METIFDETLSTGELLNDGDLDEGFVNIERTCI